jgi:predicted transcriptional regulator of viral defense system
MAATATGSRSLSQNEAKVVLDLEWRGAKTVSLADLRALVGHGSDVYARYLAHGLVRKGWLERLRPGLFRLIPAERGREAVADTNPLAAGAALVMPYFFSYGTACTHHGLTEQVFTETYIACQHDRRPEMIRDTRYIFAKVRPDRFFGFADVDVLGETVKMATRERALLDALDRPQYAGGLGEVSQMVARSARKLSWPALLDLLHRWNESALVQRLGYLWDLHGLELSVTQRSALEALVRPRSKVHVGPRGRFGPSGTLARPWNIIENVPKTILIEAGERRKRRVLFDRTKRSHAR